MHTQPSTHSRRAHALRDPEATLAPEIREHLRQRMTLRSVGYVARHLSADRLAVALAAAGVPHKSTEQIRARIVERGLP
jgi:hypothetical protein